MDYLLLTGATGLLGSYLLGEMARLGVRTAVVVRSTRFEPARHRLEAVFARWERQAGHALPRPVLLEGDLLRSGLGLSSAERRWVARNCRAVFHNAASLTFDGEKPDGEPYRTNVDGTRQLLDFCRETGIRNFHHVSTAYVAGQRKGRIYENELEAGQEFRNVYEVSKFQAEKLVRDAESLQSRTIYRPGIILGDSRTGHTTTFHAFYVPLKLVATLLSKLPADFSRDQLHAASERLREILRLDGTERKNFVTVDWVSRVMTSIYTRPEHHGKTYHLTPRQRTPMSLVQSVIQDVFFDSLDRRKDENKPPELNWEQFEKFFLEGMEVYRSHWADDPEYDATNTIAAVPHLPPPVFDAAMMRRMCQFALETNFGWPKPACPQPSFDVQERLLRRFQARNGAQDAGEAIGLQVTGSGGGDWELDWDGRSVAGFEAGIGPRAAVVCRLNTKTLERLATRETTPEQAVVTGAVLIEGKGSRETDVIRVLEEALRE